MDVIHDNVPFDQFSATDKDGLTVPAVYRFVSNLRAHITLVGSPSILGATTLQRNFRIPMAVFVQNT
jgi:hypothetical protein